MTKVLFLGKEGDDFSCAAADRLVKLGASVVYISTNRFSKLEIDNNIRPDVILSYLCQKILPEKILSSAKRYAINFHPGTPEYPGIGCVNFALYENSTFFGSTVHHMNATVDTGPIIKVSRFDLTQSDNIFTALTRTYVGMFDMFLDLAPLIASGADLPVSEEAWTRPAFTRNQLEKLHWINGEIDEKEFKRRVRALSFRTWGPQILFNGIKFSAQGLNAWEFDGN